jgi:hypothetical protein
MIKLNEEINIGSIQKLELVMHNQLSDYAPVVLNAGVAWLEIELLPDNASLLLTAEDTENGMLFTYRVNAAHTVLRDEVEDLLNPFLGQRSIVRVTDMNDRVYILGMPGTPCAFTYNGNTGNNPTEQNGYAINIQVAQPFKAKSA